MEEKEKPFQIPTRFLADTGVRVSELCLGTMNFGGFGSTTAEDEAVKIMDLYVQHGGNFLDTANVYGRGKSETVIGNWLVNNKANIPRSKLFIATKARGSMDDNDPNNRGCSRRHLKQAVDESLKRLQTDFIDLYQMHVWDAATNLEETLRTLDEIVRAGKVCYLGASNYTSWQLQKALDISNYMGLTRFVTLQPQYSLLVREIEWDIIDVCQDNRVAVLPWSPLKSGWLSGKYSKEMRTTGPPEGTRLANWKDTWANMNTDKTWNLLDIIKEISDARQKSFTQISLNWLLQQKTVLAPIIGPKDAKQLQDNIGACGWKLTEEELKKLTEASEVKRPYPYEMIQRFNKDRTLS